MPGSATRVNWEGCVSVDCRQFSASSGGYKWVSHKNTGLWIIITPDCLTVTHNTLQTQLNSFSGCKCSDFFTDFSILDNVIGAQLVPYLLTLPLLLVLFMSGLWWVAFILNSYHPPLPHTLHNFIYLLIHSLQSINHKYLHLFVWHGATNYMAHGTWQQLINRRGLSTLTHLQEGLLKLLLSCCIFLQRLCPPSPCCPAVSPPPPPPRRRGWRRWAGWGRAPAAAGWSAPPAPAGSRHTWSAGQSSTGQQSMKCKSVSCCYTLLSDKLESTMTSPSRRAITERKKGRLRSVCSSWGRLLSAASCCSTISDWKIIIYRVFHIMWMLEHLECCFLFSFIVCLLFFLWPIGIKLILRR